MKTPLTLVCLLGIALTPVNVTFASDWDRKLEEWAARSEVVCLGRFVGMRSQIEDETGEGFVTIDAIQVQRFLKGRADQSRIDVEFRTPFRLSGRPDDSVTVNFVDRKLDNGRYLLHSMRWSGELASWRAAERAIFHTDKNTHIQNMPRPKHPRRDVTLSLGADDGQGKALTDVRVADIQEPSIAGSVRKPRHAHTHGHAMSGRIDRTLAVSTLRLGSL